MAEQQLRLEEAWARIVAEAAGNPELQRRVAADPAGVLREYGVELPPGVTVRLSRVTNEQERLARLGSLLWVDGQVVVRERFTIDPSDEGLLFGRGVWESTRTFGGVPWLWALHLERLRRTAELLEIEAAPGRLPDVRQISDYVRALGVGDVVVRLNVTAGSPGRAGAVWLSAAALPQPLPAVRLRSCQTSVPAGEPALAWKTFQYGGRLRAHREAGKAGFESALLLDPAGNLLEAAHANIFVRLPGGWATPAATGGLLPGTVRRHLLESAPVPVREQVIPYALLSEASEAFLTNSILGVVPVVKIDEREFRVGVQTMELARWLLPGQAV